jgi:hypothetical protein
MSALLPPKADILSLKKWACLNNAKGGTRGVVEWLNNPETIRHLWREGANELENRPRHNRLRDQTGSMIVSGMAVLENVRKYRAIASLYRQTASFRPPQRLSLLEQAKEWERLALAELESYFSTPHGSKYLREQ